MHMFICLLQIGSVLISAKHLDKINMGFEGLLMSLVAGLMTWIIQSENCGILNILFAPAQPFEPDDPKFDLVTQFDYNYVIDTLLVKPLSYPVLKVIPGKLGGGQKAVEAANSSPNRESILFWTVIAVFLLLTFLLICTSCCFCGCCGSRNRKVSFICP